MAAGHRRKKVLKYGLTLAALMVLAWGLAVVVPLFASQGPAYAPHLALAGLLIPCTYGAIDYPEMGSHVVLHPPNESVRYEFRGPLSYSSATSATTAPLFPRLSDYWAYVRYTYSRTGDRFIVETWYFTDGKSFSDSQKKLAAYLDGRGTIAQTTLEIDRKTLLEFGPESMNSTTRRIPLTRYESGATSGYFFTVSRPSREHPDYYIAYYGVTGSSDLSRETPLLKLFFIPPIRVLDNGVVHELDTTSRALFSLAGSNQPILRNQ